MNPLPRSLQVQLVVVDLAFIAYWIATAAGLVPPQWAFSDYENPLVVAWNWSFLPLDLVFAGAGLAAVRLARAGDNEAARRLALLALTLMHASGLMALSFWAIRGDFDLAWWAPNLYLAVMPLAYLRWALCEPAAAMPSAAR